MGREAAGRGRGPLIERTGALVARVRGVPYWIADGALALTLFVAAVAQLATPYAGPRPFIRGGAVAVAQHAAVMLPLVLRRRFPLAVLACVATASALGPVLEIRDTTAQAFALTLVAYNIVAHSRVLWRSVAGAALAIAVYWQHVNPFVAPWPITWWNFTFLALIVYAGAVQNRRLRVARDLDERREELSAHREQAPQRALVAERARIAGDLQAVVTRAVAQMVEAAARATSRIHASGDASEELREIEKAARGGMSDMRRLLGVLRRGSNGARSPSGSAAAPAAQGPTSPRPGAPELYPALGLPRPHQLVDLAVAAVLAVGVLGELTLYPPGAFGPYETDLRLVGVAVVAGIVLRRFVPLPVVLAQSAGLFWLKAHDLPAPFASGTAVLVVLFSLGARRSLVEGLVGTAAAMVVSVPALLDPAADGATYGQTATLWLSIAWASWLGRTSRRTDELNGELEKTIAQIERNERAEVRTAILQERARVAGEMHDVVAHSLSLMAVQAGAARSVAGKDPAGALRSLEAVESSGRSALEELDEIQRFLLDAEEPPPAKGLEDLHGLVGQTVDAGVDVELRVEGEAGELRDAVGLSAYRIVQEALTNVRKHASGATAVVTVKHEPEALEVVIVDDGGNADPGAPFPGAGQGLVGMRERAAVFGGEVDAGPRPGGGFEVRARLPVDEP